MADTAEKDSRPYADGHRCTCGPNGTVNECLREMANNGWCPSQRRPRVTSPGVDQ